MFRTLIIYESTYGSTEEAASAIGRILGPSRCCTTEEFQEDCREFDFFVIGSGVYRGRLHDRITDFIKKNSWLRDKPVAIFSVSLSRDDGRRALSEAEKLLGGAVHSATLGGRMILDRLSDGDLEDLRRFSEVAGIEIKDSDLFDISEVIEVALDLKEIRDSLMTDIDEDKLRESIDEFLRSHNTCVLATCHGNRPRATPLEYVYDGESIYVITEGGEKFAGILENSNASVAVYEDYTSMSNLAGMQITGAVDILDEDESERIYNLRGLNPESMRNLPVDMNVIRISIHRVEFLNSRFREASSGAKQVFWFKEKV